MDLLLQKKKISSKRKELEKSLNTFPISSLGIGHINNLIDVIQTEFEVATFEHSLKEDWMEFMDIRATLMNRKTFH